MWYIQLGVNKQTGSTIDYDNRSRREGIRVLYTATADRVSKGGSIHTGASVMARRARKVTCKPGTRV